MNTYTLSPQLQLKQKQLELALLELMRDHCMESILENLSGACLTVAREEGVDPASHRMLTRLGSRLQDLSEEMVEF